MHLKKVKLAGFKSFVDPTVLNLEHNLIGIVGPNGCGKSNIIDAIRWVLGESSAKDLRGGSMLDVIFNGSNTRKAIGIASVELLFDNVENNLSKEYANFTEISIRREVDRERQSEYYLNNKKCRKRDITDLFAGTGLSQNGYAIIGQGTVSNIIEAKPEDLRNFIEEAADISIYKKRKHDTELRIAHTEENLTRVKDIILEQVRLLEKLEKQSLTAQKYLEYQKHKQEIEIKLLTVKAYKFNQELLHYADQINKISLKLEEKSAEKTNINSILEQQISNHHEKSDYFNRYTEKYYNLNTNIAKLEQTIKYKKEQQTKLHQDLALINKELEHLNQQYLKDQKLKLEIVENLDLVEKKYSIIIESSQNAEKKYSIAQANLETIQKQYNDITLQLQTTQSAIDQYKISLEQIENLSKELCYRLEKLHNENQNYSQDSLLHEISMLETKLNIEEHHAQIQYQELSGIKDKIQGHKFKIKNLSDNKNDIQSNLHKLEGTIGSLETLQQAALELNSSKLAWLNKHNLNHTPLFFNQLNIEDGWEIAVTEVLKQYLDAILLENNTIQQISLENWESIDNFKLTIVEPTLFTPTNFAPQEIIYDNKFIDNKKEDNNTNNEDIIFNSIKLHIDKTTNLNSNFKISINSKIQNNCLQNLFHHIYIVNNLSEGIINRHQLSENEFFVTKNGELIGPNWLIIDKSDHKQKILLRKKELENLEKRLEITKNELITINLNLNSEENFLIDAEKKQAEIIHHHKQQEHVIREIIYDLSSKKSKLSETQNRINKITEETKEYNNKLNELAIKEQRLRANLSEEINKISNLSIKEQELAKKKCSLKETIEPLFIANKSFSKEFHDISLKRQELITTNDSIETATVRLTKQIKTLEEKRFNLQSELNDNTCPLQPLELELNNLLNNKILFEKDLQLTKHQLEEVEFKISELENSIQNLDETIEKMRTNLEQLKIEKQSIYIRLNDTIENAKNNHSINLEENIKDISNLEDHQHDIWQEKLELLNKNINKLGMVNLAAIEEFTLESERKNYLDLQLQDLTNALETLRNAIAKIDLETRKKFKLTFDEINTNFQTLFPILFGGGGAYLELDTNDLLSTGVNVFAHPPGKKNSSIYLLSGGEKALTAVALIFSIFQLNPSPFCILDEVDAPLDEANVIRYGDLLVSMSNKVQFIFITHNKTTMKIANQLIGVTMKEPGVSRLVSVNIDEAVALID